MCCWNGSTWEARVIVVCRRPRMVISSIHHPDKLPPLDMGISVGDLCLGLIMQ